MVKVKTNNGIWKSIEVEDYRELLNDNQFIMFQRKDAVKAQAVLGTSNATLTRVDWQKEGNTTVYTDYVVTIK